MPFEDLLNLRVDMYEQSASGPVPSWSVVATGIEGRVQPLREGGAVQEGSGMETVPTDKGWFPYSYKSALVSGRVLKVTHEKLNGTWVEVTAGDEYMITGRAQDEAGAHHHLRVMLAYMPGGTVVA